MQDFLRPEHLKDFIGQEKNIENIKIFTQSALKTGKHHDHILIHGMPGLGKTTLSFIIAKLLNKEIRSITGSAVKKASDIVSIITSLKENEVLFIDEIHRISIFAEEILYTAMEDFFIDVLIGTGPGARKLKINIPKTTLIGATTKFSSLSKPLIDRFGVKIHMNEYTDEEINKIIQQYYTKNNIEFEEIATSEIANRSRKTPRNAINNAKRVIDLMHFNSKKSICKDTVEKAFIQFEIFPHGLEKLDIKYLHSLLNQKQATGINTIASIINVDQEYIQTYIEPFLLQLKFIEKSSKGRIINENGIEYLKKYC